MNFKETLEKLKKKLKNLKKLFFFQIIQQNNNEKNSMTFKNIEILEYQIIEH